MMLEHIANSSKPTLNYQKNENISRQRNVGKIKKIFLYAVLYTAIAAAFISSLVGCTQQGELSKAQGEVVAVSYGKLGSGYGVQLKLKQTENGQEESDEFNALFAPDRENIALAVADLANEYIEKKDSKFDIFYKNIRGDNIIYTLGKTPSTLVTESPITLENRVKKEGYFGANNENYFLIGEAGNNLMLYVVIGNIEKSKKLDSEINVGNMIHVTSHSENNDNILDKAYDE
jgi:hypothetical protein